MLVEEAELTFLVSAYFFAVESSKRPRALLSVDTAAAEEADCALVLVVLFWARLAKRPRTKPRRRRPRLPRGGPPPPHVALSFDRSSSSPVREEETTTTTTAAAGRGVAFFTTPEASSSAAAGPAVEEEVRRASSSSVVVAIPEEAGGGMTRSTTAAAAAAPSSSSSSSTTGEGPLPHYVRRREIFRTLTTTSASGRRRGDDGRECCGRPQRPDGEAGRRRGLVGKFFGNSDYDRISPTASLSSSSKKKKTNVADTDPTGRTVTFADGLSGTIVAHRDLLSFVLVAEPSSRLSRRRPSGERQVVRRVRGRTSGYSRSSRGGALVHRAPDPPLPLHRKLGGPLHQRRQVSRDVADECVGDTPAGPLEIAAAIVDPCSMSLNSAYLPFASGGRTTISLSSRPGRRRQSGMASTRLVAATTRTRSHSPRYASFRRRRHLSLPGSAPPSISSRIAASVTAATVDNDTRGVALVEEHDDGTRRRPYVPGRSLSRPPPAVVVAVAVVIIERPPGSLATPARLPQADDSSRSAYRHETDGAASSLSSPPPRACRSLNEFATPTAVLTERGLPTPGGPERRKERGRWDVEADVRPHRRRRSSTSNEWRENIDLRQSTKSSCGAGGTVPDDDNDNDEIGGGWRRNDAIVVVRGRLE
ncbi:hypothetical protein ACHAW5_011224 [Stephanodiscus triporus]|uniref:Uncharacterized protein n=1 Tax=Stephanodiscus triporus TaxID=2934178 RepID=A0ABD3PCD7_9STRA